MQNVHFYLDFISPYTWLALKGAERFAQEHRVEWEVRPVVYAALLTAHGLVGPAETAAKRRYTFYDVSRIARLNGWRISGPPRHPFRSLEALRTLFLFREDPYALKLAVRLADACWAEGRDLEDAEVRSECVDQVGLDASDLEERIAAPGVKDGLRGLTESAITDGIFGVPTFVVEGELFWGHDRLEHLARFLSGDLGSASTAAEEILARPRGVDRRRST